MPRKQGERTKDPRWRSHLEPAPGDLRLIQAFANTAASDSKREDLTGPQALADWLVLWDLMHRRSKLDPKDLESALELRADLRGLIAANQGSHPPPRVVERLNRKASTAPSYVYVASDGHALRDPGAEGFGEALVHFFDVFYLAQHDDLWRRLKVCAREGCGSVFYDFSNARLAKWCSARCGARGSSKTYRDRRARWRRQQSAVQFFDSEGS